MPEHHPATRGEPATRRLVRGALLERLPLKLLALFFAVVLWFAVSVDEPAERRVAVRLAVRADSAVILEGDEPVLTATITGRRRDLLKVSGRPLVVRRTLAPGTGDSVQFAVRPSDVELPPGVEGDVRVRAVEPRVVTLRFVRGAAAPAAASAAARGAQGAP